MLFFDHIRRGALGAAMTLVLALADGCPATWKLDFDELEPGTGLGTNWDAFGFHFNAFPDPFNAPYVRSSRDVPRRRKRARCGSGRSE